MIPKIIHYCWFGGNELPDLARKCIESWKKYLPDYEIKVWDESNFDLDLYKFTREAYNHKKFAYVTDVVRLYVLKNEGGIYLDSDVEILKPLDKFLYHSAFSGFENNNLVPTGIMASEKNSKWACDMLDYYEGRSFLDNDGRPILESNVFVISKLMEEKGIILNNHFQELKDYITFYPYDFFCPKDWYSGKIFLTENTHCIHHFAGSWLTSKEKNKIKYYNLLKKIFGSKNLSSLKKILNK